MKKAGEFNKKGNSVAKRFTAISFLVLMLFLIITNAAFSADRSVIIGFHEKPDAFDKALVNEAKGVIKHTFSIIPAMSITISEEGIDKIKKHGKIKYIEEDGVVGSVDPLSSAEYTNSWGVMQIRADLVHAAGVKGAGVKIAVLDTGIDYSHPDLTANYRGGYDFAYGDADPFDGTTRSHGTHVAGIIAAQQNGSGVVGVAPEAELYAVKVLDDGGFGLVSWVIQGIEWAVSNGMHIINMSLEGQHFQSLQDACDNAYASDILLVAAAGNSYGQPVGYPAAYSSVVAVTATDANDVLASLSSVGPEVELSAPGVSIFSAVSGGGNNYLSGTSQAAPHVTGTAALLISSGIADMNMDGKIAEDVRLKLRQTARDLGMAGKDDLYGYGGVDAAASVLSATGFTIHKTSGPSSNDARNISLSGALYRITITNNCLSKMTINVYENNIIRKDLSKSYRFGSCNEIREFYLDTTGKTLNLTFIPGGKSGASADVAALKVP